VSSIKKYLKNNCYETIYVAIKLMASKINYS